MNMKRIYVVLLTVAAFCMADVCAEAQIKDDVVERSLSVKGDRIFDGEQKLSKAELKTIFCKETYEEYAKARRLSRFGATMTGIGGTIFTLSTVGVVGGIIIHNKPSSQPKDTPVGIVIFEGTMIVGGLMMAAGIPCICVGCKRIKNLDLAPASNGVGLALKF